MRVAGLTSCSHLAFDECVRALLPPLIHVSRLMRVAGPPPAQLVSALHLAMVANLHLLWYVFDVARQPAQHPLVRIVHSMRVGSHYHLLSFAYRVPCVW